MSRNSFVLITIECLRKSEYQVSANAPNLNEIAKTGLTYPNFYSSSSWTAPAVFSLLTSEYPLADGGRVSIGKRDPTLAQLLHEGGYYTAGLTGGWWLARYFGFDKGFEDFFDGDVGGRGRGGAVRKVRDLGRRLIVSRTTAGDAANCLFRLERHLFPAKRLGERLNGMALKWLDDRRGDRPYFLWVHFPETHEPYFPSRRIVTHSFREIWRANRRAHRHLFARRGEQPMLSDREIALLLDLYRAELKRVDGNVARLLDGLTRAGHLDENTYVFITGDHGQQFFEHGGYGHGLYLYQELCNVPLIVHRKGLQGGEDVRPASGLDIAPTILQLAGLACPRVFRGRSLLDNPGVGARDIFIHEGEDRRGDTIIRGNNVYLDVSKYRVALVRGRHKLIMDSHGELELFDLEADPHEQNNLAGTEVELCSTLRSQLMEHLQEMHGRDLEERTRSRIRELRSMGRV